MTWTAATQQSEAWAEVSRSAETWSASSVADRLYIISVSPDFGASGTLVTITGQNFTDVTSITIDDLEASFTISDDSTIIVTVP